MEHYSNFCTFEIASLVNVPGHYLRKYGIRPRTIVSVKALFWKCQPFILQVRDRSVADLSGGELQRFACAMVCIQKADIFMFDEPSSYLDVKQRLNAAEAIRNLIEATKYVIVVEHDLAVLGKFWRIF